MYIKDINNKRRNKPKEYMYNSKKINYSQFSMFNFFFLIMGLINSLNILKRQEYFFQKSMVLYIVSQSFFFFMEFYMYICMYVCVLCCSKRELTINM